LGVDSTWDPDVFHFSMYLHDVSVHVESSKAISRPHRSRTTELAPVNDPRPPFRLVGRDGHLHVGDGIARIECKGRTTSPQAGEGGESRKEDVIDAEYKVKDIQFSAPAASTPRAAMV
jgi:hypothetical protein